MIFCNARGDAELEWCSCGEDWYQLRSLRESADRSETAIRVTMRQAAAFVAELRPLIAGGLTPQYSVMREVTSATQDSRRLIIEQISTPSYDGRNEHRCRRWLLYQGTYCCSTFSEAALTAWVNHIVWLQLQQWRPGPTSDDLQHQLLAPRKGH